MTRVAVAAALWLGLGMAEDARAERCVVADIAAPPELTAEAGAVQLLVKSALAKLTLVDAPAAADHTATAELSRARTGLELDVSIVGRDGKRETTSIFAGDGDVVALATGMASKIGDVTHTTPQPVKPFALGQLRPYATALRLAHTDPPAAIAVLADAAPVVALGVPAIGLAFGDLLAAAPTPAARLVVARAIGATDMVATIGTGQDAVAAAARAFAAIDRADLATAETALVNATGGLAALGRAAIAAQHDDVRLGQLLENALGSDQRRAALALASTIVPEHVSSAVHRTLLPLAEKAAATSPGVASRIGFAAAQAKVDVARALALVSVRELDAYAIDGLAAILDAHKDLPKPTLLRLRAELAMRRGEPSQALVNAFLEGAPGDPRAQQYAGWSAIEPKHAAGAGSATPPLFDEPFVPPASKPAASPLDILLPVVAGVGVLVLVTLVLIQRRKRRPQVVTTAPVLPQPISRPRHDKPDSIAMPGEAAAVAPRPANKLKIDMTTPPPAPIDVPGVPAPPTSAGRSYPSAASQSELGDRLQGLIDVELPADLPVARPVTLPPPIDVASASRSPLDVDRHTPMPMRGALDSPFADADPLGAPELMALGSDPTLATGSAPSSFADIALDEPIEPPAPVAQRTLATVLAERGKLPWLEAVGIIDQVCASLAKTHEAGAVNGGVQPASIFIAGRVATLGENLAINRPPYGPKVRSRTSADDLYALGATLTEMLDLEDVPPKLADLVAGLRASRITSVAQVRKAFKALFDF